jgi:lipopolysaccharide transport system ATP-binding protein
MPHAIVVEGLSKQYTIGKVLHETMIRERLISLLTRPFQRRAVATDTLWALRDVTFRVDEGEVVGIIGRNGAGKSTLLKILSKITFPTTGRVRTRGRLASLLEVGIGFHEELTGRENIFLNGSILGMKKKEVEARFDRIVEFAGVERFIETQIKRYSSGMRLRLGFAVAAHLDPDVLLVDEVLAVGDVGFQKKCLNTMNDLQRGGRTILFVSHNMAALENLCSRGIWIDAGRVVQDGDAKEVIRAYMATFAPSGRAITDLRDVSPRAGTGEIRFTGVEILEPTGATKTMTFTGDAVTIRFRYRASQLIPGLSVGFRLDSELGTLVTRSSSAFCGVEIRRVLPGDGFLDVHLDALNLMPARYHVSLQLVGVPGHLYDGLEHCVQLEVLASDAYGSGQRLDHRHGIVFFPQRWTLSGVRRAADAVEEPPATADGG